MRGRLRECETQLPVKEHNKQGGKLTYMVKLIIADDHVVLREALKEMLEGKGKFTIVGQAADGEQLLDVVKHQSADVIVLDVQMPKLDGLSAIQKMAEEGRQLPVLVFSADESERNVRAAFKAGAKGFLPKNAGPDELEFAINSVAAGKTYVSPSVTAALVSGQGAGSGGNGSPLSVLTKREIEILTHLADGKPNRVIGKMLHISTRTVDTHRSNILKKLDMKTNAELVKLAIGAGLISV